MKNKKMVTIAIAIALLVAGVVFFSIAAFQSNGSEPPVTKPSPNETGTTTSVPFEQQTLEPTAPEDTEEPEETSTPTSTPSPTNSADESGEVPSALAPDFEVLEIDGFGYAEAMEADLTEDEIETRKKLYQVIATMNNRASFIYEDSYGARDELLKRGLITDHMADVNFYPEFSYHQQAINKAKYTVQTTGVYCAMRGQTPMTALEMGQVTCYFTREYVDQEGDDIPISEYTEETGGSGAIDPDQIARIILDVKEVDGEWKVDDIQYDVR